MKVFVALSALLAVASATPLYLAPIPTSSSQYHSQDGIGQYAYGYNDHLSNKQEIKSLDGITRGAYSYIDSNNVLQTVNYISDAGGFRVTATNLPKPVEAPIIATQDLPQQVPDTWEVAAAKSAHFAAVEEAKLRLGVQEIIPLAVNNLPQQVQDTPEVAKAKAEHFAAIEAAKNQILIIPSPIGHPQQVVDTPEVAKAKAEHLLAIEQAKLRNSAPLITSPIQLSASSSAPLPSGGFSYSSSVVNSPIPPSIPPGITRLELAKYEVLAEVTTASKFISFYHSLNMKVFVAFTALLALASASTLYLVSTNPSIPAISSQYHSQDGTGQYAYGYNDHLSTKQEVKSLDGTTRGAYSYIDSNNILQTVNYIADSNGFRVSGTNLPKPIEAQDLPQQVPDTEEVAAAKSAHFAAVEEAKQRLGLLEEVPLSIEELPQKIQDTPEISKAEEEHFAAIESAKNQDLAVSIPTELPQQEVSRARADHFAVIEAANQVIAASLELPQLVAYTPEVAFARATHFAAMESANNRVGSNGFTYSTSVVHGPGPVSYEPYEPYFGGNF
ncbi:uncharacterized protein LOC129909327 [Episyrphus balteatus]|uniref:uncharacterized protein LOC129909327 n=1 Tax=Episyrphus balteatus TaxID=286459 RepID=UPI0024851A56|nr:uncharacterized protein LOC129909327 [Episyrphus balteatus]